MFSNNMDFYNASRMMFNYFQNGRETPMCRYRGMNMSMYPIPQAFPFIQHTQPYNFNPCQCRCSFRHSPFQSYFHNDYNYLNNISIPNGFRYLSQNFPFAHHNPFENQHYNNTNNNMFMGTGNKFQSKFLQKPFSQQFRSAPDSFSSEILQPIYPVFPSRAEIPTSSHPLNSQIKMPSSMTENNISQDFSKISQQSKKNFSPQIPNQPYQAFKSMNTRLNQSYPVTSQIFNSSPIMPFNGSQPVFNQSQSFISSYANNSQQSVKPPSQPPQQQQQQQYKYVKVTNQFLQNNQNIYYHAFNRVVRPHEAQFKLNQNLQQPLFSNPTTTLNPVYNLENNYHHNPHVLNSLFRQNVTHEMPSFIAHERPNDLNSTTIYASNNQTRNEIGQNSNFHEIVQNTQLDNKQPVNNRVNDINWKFDGQNNNGAIESFKRLSWDPNTNKTNELVKKFDGLKETSGFFNDQQ
jgi:hypothetical protein